MPRVARLFLRSFLLFGLLAGALTGIPAQQADSAGPPILAAGEAEGKNAGEIPEEASAYLLDTRLGDADVNLVWDGYWRVSFVAGGSFGRRTPTNTFNGLAQGATFFQEPDLTLTLWLDDRWFLETTFLEGFDRNTYRAGYRGRDDEFVREVVAGNAGVNANPYAGIEVPKPQYNTPGIVGKFGTDRSDHEILLRFDPTETQGKTFQGAYEVQVQNLGPADYVRGRYFILPDTGVSNVRVYLEDRLGSVSGTDGLGTLRRYRLAEPTEFFVDEDAGLVELAEPHDGQVAVYYDGPNGAVGNGTDGRDFVVPADPNTLRPDLAAWGGVPANLEDFDWSELDDYDPLGTRTYGDTSQVAMNDIANPALIVSTPGGFTPFERMNVYESERPLPEDSWRLRPLIQDRGALYPAASPDFDITADPPSRTVSVFNAGEAADASDLRDPANRYPFADADPEVYGPAPQTDPQAVSRQLVLAIRESNPGYDLGGGVVPGSVVVTVNGVRDSTASLADDGSLEFRRLISPDDWIEVSYRTDSLDLEGGDLFVFQGNRFRIGDRFTWELAESLRWNISPDRTVEEFAQSPGEIKVASTLDWAGDRADWSLSGFAALSTPDTTGNLRLFGMEEGGFTPGLFDSGLFRSPEDIPSYASGNRVPLDEYDYIAYDAFGRAVLNPYTWTGAADTGADGPGLAADLDGDPSDGRVMELRFNLGAGQWSAGDALADSGGPVDLSAGTAIEVPIRFYGGGTGSEPDVILQAGEIGESEDGHDDGSVNGIDAGALLEWDLSDAGDASIEWETNDFSAAWAGSWAVARITLSGADRARLGRVRSWRLVVDAAGGAAAGRLIAGAPTFVGAPFRTEIRTPGDALAAAQDVAGDEIVDNSLKTDFPETAELFHPNGESNSALRIRWGSDAGGSDIGDNRWEAVSWFDGVPIEAYRTLVFYTKAQDDGAGVVGNLSARITDENGDGIVASWSPNTTGWDRISIDIPSGTAVSASGAAVSVSVDGRADELLRFVLAGADDTGDATASADSGTLELDEIHFSDPAYTITGGAAVEGSWSHPEDVAVWGAMPLLGDIRLSGRTEFRGGDTLSGLERSATAVAADVSAGADLIGVGVETDWRVSRSAGDTSWSGSHELRIPARSPVFWLTDRYSRSVAGTGVTFSRLNDVNLSLPPVVLRSFGETAWDGFSLVQTWGGSVDAGDEAWEASTEFSYTLESEADPGDSADYFGSWIRDYAYLAPSGDPALGRDVRHGFDFRYSLGPVSLEWDPEIGMSTERLPSWTQENRWNGRLSMPLRFDDWSLTAAYSRSLRLKEDVSSRRHDGFDDAWGLWIDGVGGHVPLATYVPFGELFGRGDADRFAERTVGLLEADYESEFSVDVRRGGGSRIRDLVLPSSATAAMRRDHSRKGDTSGWEDEWRYAVGFSSVNLFGRFGRYPLVDFYNTDEFYSLYQLTLGDLNNPAPPTPREFLWDTDWTFIGSRSRRFTLNHRIAWDWDAEARETRQEAALEYRWRTPSRESLQLPLVRRTIPREHYMENRERLALSGLYPWFDAPAESVLDLGFVVTHESTWVFPDAGHLKGWLSVGLGGRDDEFTNGWELGLEAEIRF